MWTKRFWTHVLENMIGRAAVAVLTVTGTDAMVNAFSLDYAELGGIAGGAALLSVLVDLATKPLGADTDTPRLSG